MSDPDYTSGPHPDDQAAVRAVGEAGHCAIVGLHHVDGHVLADVWKIDEVALYLIGAQPFLYAFAETVADQPAPPRGATGYAMVIPPGSVACLIDPAGTTTTVELGPQFQDDRVGRDEVYDGLRAVLTADREARVPPAAKAFPPANTDQPHDASTPPAPPSPDRPSHRRSGR